MNRIKIFYWTVVLVVLDIITICIISGIYIKFVSASIVTQIASIEKWGVKITAPANTLERSYASDDGSTVTIHTHSDYDEIIAPGNETNLGHFTVTGTPTDKIEIACTSKLQFNNWYVDEADTEEYCPIVFTIGDDVYRVSNDIYPVPSDEISDNVHLYSSVEEFESGVETAIKEMYEQKGTYQNDGDTWNILYDDVAWTWDYYKSDTNDVYDTILGNREVLPTIDVYISLKVEWDDNTDSDTPAGGTDDEEPQPPVDLYALQSDSDNTIDSEDVPQAYLLSDTGETIDEAPTPLSYLLPVTGDSFTPILWISLMVVSATVIIVMIIVLVKRKKGQTDGNKTENHIR